MKLFAFALLDTKTGAFSTPFFYNHRGLAFRTVIDVAADPNTHVGRHPADFALYQVGEFDDQTGLLVSQHPEPLGTVLSICGDDARPQLPLMAHAKE